MTVENSYFDSLADLSVADILSSTELLEGAAAELMAGEQAYELLFQPHTVDAMTVKYHLDTAPGLDEELQKVAEFAEIPVGDPTRGEVRHADLEDFGIGLRLSYKQRRFGTGSDIQRELLGRMAEIRRGNSKAALAAIAAEDIEELPVEVKWNTAEGKAMDDVYAADDLLAGAADDNGNPFNYSGKWVWGNRKTLNAFKRNKQVTEFYTGDMAHADPRFTPLSAQPVIGEQFFLVVDPGMADGKLYVIAESLTGGIGTRFETGAPIFTDWYEEGGQSGIGGPRLTWRSDYVHTRALAIRAPKAIVKITGAI